MACYKFQPKNYLATIDTSKIMYNTECPNSIKKSSDATDPYIQFKTFTLSGID